MIVTDATQCVVNQLGSRNKSSVSSCSFPTFGTGVNLSPLVSREISGSVRFLFEKLIILMSVLFLSIVAGVCAHCLWF